MLYLKSLISFIFTLWTLKVRIQAHVANYMGMFIVSTGFAYLVSYSFGKSEEEKLRELVIIIRLVLVQYKYI